MARAIPVLPLVGSTITVSGPDKPTPVGDDGRVSRAPVSRALAARMAQVQRFTGTNPAAVATITVLLGLAALMAAISAAIYDAVTEEDGAALLDRPALDLAVSLRTPARDAAVTAFTDLGGTPWMPVIATVMTIGLALTWRVWAPITLMALASAGSLLMTAAGKAVVGRTRPPEIFAVPPLENSASFPSGHSLNAVVVAGLVAYLVVERYRAALLRIGVVVVAGGFAVAMGLSRVFLGHHWLTDVLVAWALGLGWLALVVTGHRVWILRTGRGVVVPEVEPEVTAAAD